MKTRSRVFNVRNNREFAFLEKEKEFESLEIELAEKNIRQAIEKQEAKAQEIANTEEELNDNEHILEDKRVSVTRLFPRHASRRSRS